MRMLIWTLAILVLFSVAGPLSHEARAGDEQFDRGHAAVQSMAGCFLADYSWS
jgi:hypothetical protein